ncbi:hypothetical protein DFP74_1749 [Nocardiopsis sp. Huas11]|uniref:hypothetical protein n=1 Tax=Nocardiopsis sp. Huas11 TaxID=2183912 RepID=UPI000EAF979F|nr:hypothetical protein [Nocardiopsis sp. Huas11]RKS06126.1 hypothetical protein DFP74_1749 [Nocardiopsis sp. Huas11]
MTPHRPTARRVLAGGTLFIALGALGAVSAAPATASATPLVWGHAQSWVADGDLVTGYSTVIGFGGDTEENTPADALFGPLADYADVRGRSSAVVDTDGASARSTVDSATVRLGVDDLADLGLLDLPDGAARPSASPSAQESSAPSPSSEPENDVQADPGTAPDSGDGSDGPVIAEESGPEPEEPVEEDEPRREPSSGPAAESPSPSASPSDGEDADEDVVVLDDTNSRTASGTDNTVEFTLSEVTGTADAAFDGTTDASLRHGDLTAFGVPVGSVDQDGVTVEDTLEILGEDGDVLETVPVSVRFAATEATFDDEDRDWTGKGVRTALTVWIQVGEDVEDVLSVDFADAWALGSTFGDAVGSPDPTDRRTDASPNPTSAPKATDSRLATTGSSLAALVTAAVVAVGGGAAATFLARKRTTALDDQIGD